MLLLACGGARKDGLQKGGVKGREEYLPFTQLRDARFAAARRRR